ncbi:MAG: hypothetical protein QM764_11775 [Chitinophagaceae bacterium]
MTRLIIGSDTISINDDGVSFTGQVARLIAGNEIIFLIKYTPPGNNTVLRKVKRNFNKGSNKFGWFNYPANNQDEFSEAIGQEIEKQPHLLTFTT